MVKLKLKSQIIVSVLLLIIISVLSISIGFSKSSYLKNQISYNSVLNKDVEVDVVVTWVDSGNSLFILERDRYISGKNNSIRLPESKNTFIEINECVRLIFKNLKFIRNLIVVTCRPQTLPNAVFSQMSNTQRKKIRVIHHDQFIPKKYLPTFNSNCIEMFIHLLPGLSENFIYMNDDFYILKKRKLNDFFVTSKKNNSIIPRYNCMKKNFMLNSLKYRLIQEITMLPFINNTHTYCLLKNIYEYMNMSNSINMYEITHAPVPLTKTIMDSMFAKHIYGFDKIWDKCRFRCKDDYMPILITLHNSIMFGDAVLETKNKLKTCEVEKISQKNITHKLQYDFLSINSLDIESETEIQDFFKLLNQY